MNSLTLRLANAILLLLSISLSVFSVNKIEHSNNLENDTMTILFKEYIPDNYEIRHIAKGFINADTLTDYALIIRDSIDWDSNKLIVLFQEQNNLFVKSIETDKVISTRYNNQIRISDNIIYIHSFIPWHGMDEHKFEIKFELNDWFCLRVFFTGGDPNNYWENSYDFETGKYTIKHTKYLKDEDKQIREIEGIVENIKPISIIKDDIDKHLDVEYNGKNYFILDRCNLWTKTK